MAHFYIEDLTFTFPGGSRPALDKVSLTIEKGEYVVLCGKSGSGKTTLLRHLKPVLRPHGTRAGKVLFDGAPLENCPAKEQAARIGFVMQDPDDQIVTDKVWHELAFGLESIGCEPGVMRLRVAEMAGWFGIEHWFDRDTATLSGGQKQLLNLASVMAMQPEVLILDEPTSQLDPIAAADFLNTVRRINRELGTTVILTEHRLEDVFPSADRVVVMEKGRITANDTPRRVGELLWQQKSELFAALPAPVRIFYAAGKTGTAPLTVREGRVWLSGAFEKDPPAITQPEDVPFCAGEKTPALSLRDVWFRYERDSADILRSVDLTVPAGSIFAVVGGNGAGKSTALRVIGGAAKAYRGKVQIFGRPIREYRAGSLYQNCLAMLPQDPKSLFVKKTVEEDLLEVCSDRQLMADTARLCAVEHLLSAHPHDLSGGEQQRAALAKVLLCRPRLLLLDEPTKGLDSFFKQQFAGILKQLAKQGTTVLLVSHDVEFCAEHADLVGMFFDGQILTVDTPRRFFGKNSFYTTSADRMSRCVFQNAVTAQDVADLYLKNKERGEGA